MAATVFRRKKIMRWENLPGLFEDWMHKTAPEKTNDIQLQKFLQVDENCSKADEL